MTVYIPSPSVAPFMTPFPEAADVFAGDVAAHRRVLQPLLSIEASAVDPTWRGKLHIVTPLEPYDGLVGDGTETYHRGYCVPNWIAFNVADSRYTFAADFRYFKINSCADRDRDFYEHDYRTKEASFADHVAHYRATGKLGHSDHPDFEWNWLNQVGGDACDGNWTADAPNIEIVDDDENDVSYAHPLTSDGRRFRFVASATGFNYRENCADEILLFFDPQSSVALLTFDWT